MKIVKSKERTILKNPWSRVGISNIKVRKKLYKGNLAKSWKYPIGSFKETFTRSLIGKVTRNLMENFTGSLIGNFTGNFIDNLT